jgi:predicted RNA-binding Zn-ribbon protein involved in translation (DUF1610 family)
VNQIRIRALSPLGIGVRILAGLPLILITLALMMAGLAELSVRLQMRKIARSACPNCGNPVGLEVLRSARKEAGSPYGKGGKTVGGFRLRRRFIAHWNFACPYCGMQRVLTLQ